MINDLYVDAPNPIVLSGPLVALPSTGPFGLVGGVH